MLAILDIIEEAAAPLDVEAVASRFHRAKRDRVAAILTRLAQRRLILDSAGHYTRATAQQAA